MNIVKLAVVGGGRGAHFARILSNLSDKIHLVAVCDSNEEILARWKTEFPNVSTYSSYDDLLQDKEVTAIFIATPLFIHARQAIQALKAGKHVMSEVIASHTLEDSWELIAAVEETGLTYMLAENYCFMRPNMMVKNMLDHDLFGEITYVEGGYIHDCRTLSHYEDGSITWRGELMRQYNGNVYPTHSLGPLAQWLGINREGGDEFVDVTTFMSKAESVHNYYEDKLGSEHPGADKAFWGTGDTSITLIRTKKGVLIKLIFDMVSARPHNMTHYSLQGSKGAYLSGRHEGEEPIIWINGLSKGESPDGSAAWEPLWNHAEKWEHPLWEEYGVQAENAGHGGGDYYVLREFADAILEKRKPAIDVYDAVLWSSIFPLSLESVAAGGKPVKFPDFRNGSIKTI